MESESAPEPGAAGRGAWWREPEVAWLVILVVATYFIRAGVLPLRGEEPTRAQIAYEMVVRGDWIVPREQGEPFLIRPPLQNWIIAASCLSLGDWGAWAVRFPSVLATLFTTLLVYGYSRTFLTRTGALAAGAAFATLGEMFQMGRQAETEALFIFLLSTALITWHWGVVRRWPAAATWAVGYGFMALAMLTKGNQAPAYFVGSVGVYLVLTRDWRRLFSLAHLFGMAFGGAVLAGWLIPYYFAAGWSAVVAVWTADPAYRALGWPLREVVRHLVEYPFEVAAGTLPWSLLLLVYLSREFRRAVGMATPQILFPIICLAVAFPTCWLPPSGRARFFAPLYPCLAVLVGVAVERCAAAAVGTLPRIAWRRFLTAVTGAMAVAVVAVVAAAGLKAHDPNLAPWAGSVPGALLYTAAVAGLAALVLRARVACGDAWTRPAVLAVAVFMAVTFAGVGTDIRLRLSEDGAAAMRRLKDRLPSGQQLVSLDGHTDSLFAYLYGQPFITPGTWPAPGPDAGAGLTYFCFVSPGDRRPPLPFAWDEVGVVSLDRNHRPVPERVVVVGRRVPTPSSAQAAARPAPGG
jgi:4-amino-4-deoxy-L-arabinose transferase-like glycosyltransferase